MGFADLIPGVSGGTIAFMCGIYEELIESINSLQFQSVKKIAWPFLLPLGLGMVTSIFFFSKVFHFLLLHYREFLFSFFSGLIIGSSFILIRKINITKSANLTGLLFGGLVSFLAGSLVFGSLFGTTFWGLLISGVIGGAAMLLPGVSGSYLLQMMGVYPLLLFSLSSPGKTGSISILFAVGVGVALGLIMFSRIVSYLLTSCRQFMLALLAGFMVGGLKALWPFEQEFHLISVIWILMGIISVMMVEAVSQLRSQRNET